MFRSDTASLLLLYVSVLVLKESSNWFAATRQANPPNPRQIYLRSGPKDTKNLFQIRLLALGSLFPIGLEP